MLGPAAVVDAASSQYALTVVASADIAPALPSDLTTLTTVTLDNLITFTRPGEATYVGADGLIHTAAVDVPRFDYTNGRRQLLLEGPATNLCLNKDITLLSRGANTTVTHMPDEIGPDGQTGNVYRVEMPAASLTYVLLHSINQGVSVTASLFAKKYSESLKDFSITVGSSVQTVHTATDEWTRYSESRVTGNYNVGLTNNTPDSSDAYAIDILVAFPQVESEVGATSYIPTAGSAVTRPADKAQLSEALAALLRRGEVSVLLQGERIYGTGTGGSGWLLSGPGGGDYLFVLASNGVQIKGGMPGYVLASIAQPLPKFGVISAWDSLNLEGVYSGDGVIRTGSGPQSADLSSVLIARNASSGFANVWYDQIVIWPFRMTNADLQAKAVPYA
nr:hypothetical protein [Marinicella sp. W31]MDC2877853.1 hypothetical protein [Marinicella sp. W31]